MSTEVQGSKWVAELKGHFLKIHFPRDFTVETTKLIVRFGVVCFFAFLDSHVYFLC